MIWILSNNEEQHHSKLLQNSRNDHIIRDVFDLSALTDQKRVPKEAQRDVAVDSFEQLMVGKTYQVAPDNRISAHSPRDIISKANGRANQNTIEEHDNTHTPQTPSVNIQTHIHTEYI